jgi:hypothetical protein
MFLLMADITKCDGRNCPWAKTCYRTIAESNPNGQSWFMDVPYDADVDDECEYYWSIDESR